MRLVQSLITLRYYYATTLKLQTVPGYGLAKPTRVYPGYNVTYKDHTPFYGMRDMKPVSLLVEVST